MTKAILTLNAGSSSVKFALFDCDNDLAALQKGQISGIGTDAVLKIKDGTGATIIDRDVSDTQVANPGAALRLVLNQLDDIAPGLCIHAIGHRIVHGGV